MAHAQTIETADIRSWPSASGGPLLPAVGPRLTFSREAEIFGEGERSEHIYQVLGGVVRTCRFSSDGRRQIEDFHLAGEYFGLEMGPDHSCSAEAIGEVTVQLLKRSTLMELATRDVDVTRRLLELTMSSLARAQKHVDVLSRKGACERVAAFLLDFADRSGAAAFVDLPMSRQEIGDYLGLTIETVSRTFTQLEADRLIGLADRRRVVLRNREQLLTYRA